MNTPERVEQPQLQEAPPVVEMPEEFPSAIEKAVPGAQAVKTQFTAQVTDDTGVQLIQSPATQAVTITIPATAQQLDDWSHGAADESLTWLAAFWLRIIKKALHFGWKVVTGQVVPNQT